jgi:hypothetical protein
MDRPEGATCSSHAPTFLSVIRLAAGTVPPARTGKGVVSPLSGDLDFDGPARNETEQAGRVEPSVTLQSRSQIRVMPENSESACRRFSTRSRVHLVLPAS